MITALLFAAALAVPPPVTGDFDHDGRPDRAELVPAGEGYRLQVRLAARPQAPVVVDTTGELEGFYFRLARPGTITTWCGKERALDRKAPCPRRTVRLRRDTLEFGFTEKASAVAPWTGRGFEVIWISD